MATSTAPTPASTPASVPVTARVLQRAADGAAVEQEIRRTSPNLYTSFLQTRLLVGAVGVLLPTVLLAWDLVGDLVQGRPPALLGSLSAYYYHPNPLRDWFVGSLWAIGVGLMVYMGTRKISWANAVSCCAGVAAIVVSLFPTSVDETLHWYSLLHFAAAAVVITALGLLCVGFGIYDKVQDGTEGATRSHRGLHYTAAGVIAFSLVLAVVHSAFEVLPGHGLLIAEVLAVYAFAVSWFTKGWELFAYTKMQSTQRALTSPR